MSRYIILKSATLLFAFLATMSVGKVGFAIDLPPELSTPRHLQKPLSCDDTCEFKAVLCLAAGIQNANFNENSLTYMDKERLKNIKDGCRPALDACELACTN